jgi:ribose 5-phosphate isomerase B
VLSLIKIFIAEPFSNDERHVRRIKKIGIFETSGEVQL